MSAAVRTRPAQCRLVRDVVVTPHGTRLGIAGSPAGIVVSQLPSEAEGAAAVAGLRHLSWVKLVVHGGLVVRAEVAGTTRIPVRRSVTAAAALHLARVGVAAIVERPGD